MKHRKRRWGSAERFLSILLAVVMVLSLAPENMLTLAVYAEERAIEEPVEKNTTEEPVDESATGESTEEDPSEGGDMEKPSEGEDTEKPAGSDVEKPSEGEDTENPVGESDVEEPSEGETTENPARENDEEKPADAEEGLCPHHEQHTKDCGYGETTPCGYECKICPVQDLIDALPDGSEITAENAADVEKQLAEIDEAKAELTDEELDELDTARYEAAVSALLVLEDMKGANVPELLATNYDVSTGSVVISTDGDYTITGTTTSNTITVESGVNANITLNNVSINVSGTEGAAAFKIADDSAGNVSVTLEGTNVLKSGADCAGLQKNGESGVGTLTITGSGSLNAVGGGNGAGIGGSGTNSRNEPGGSTANITIENGTITAQGGADTVDTGIEGYSPEYGGAGIGGGANGSGSNITITGGTVNATGGAGSSGGAGIGGGKDGNGSIIIRGSADVKAQGGAAAAGIGAGCNSSIGAGHSGTVTIEGGTVIATGGTNSSFGGAGIGAGYSSHANVTINGGTVTATGGSNAGSGSGGAGIGSSGGIGNATVKISGGTVIAKGGDDKNGGAGIGGGVSGYAVNVTISGGTVTATGGSNISSDGSGGPGAGIGLNAGGSGSVTFSTTGDSGTGNAFIIVMGGTGSTPGDGITNGVSSAGNGLIVNGETTVWGAASYTLSQDVEIPAGVTLTIPNGKTLTVNSTLTNNGTLLIEKGGTLSGGTLNGNGNFVTTELTEDMITVPTGLFYDGNDRTEYIKQNTTLASKTHCGKEFQVTGWTQSVTKDFTSDLKYTVTYTPDGGGTPITKNVTLGQSGTQFVGEGVVKAYKGDTEASEFTYGETITVKATPTPTGSAPMTASLNSLTEPASGQMALYLGDKQVSAAVDKGNSQYTMTASVKDLIAAGAQYNQETTLTAKFVGNDYMVDGMGTVNVTLKPATLTISGATLAAKIYDTTNSGTVESVTLDGIVSGDTLTLGTDYTATATYNTADAGTGKTATVTVTLTNGNYTFADGAKEATHTLNGQTITAKTVTADVTVTPDKYEYTGSAIVPTAEAVKVTYTDDEDKEVTIPSSEYTFTCTNNTGTGIATLTINDAANGNYDVSGSGTFEITKPSLTTAKVTLGQTSYTYDGTAKEPTVTVEKNGSTVDPSEYAISYSNTSGGNDDHTNAGTVTVTVTAKTDGHYSGSNSANFTISQAALPEMTLSATSTTYTGSAQKPTVTVGSLIENTDYEVSYTCGGTATTDFTNAGEITVTVTGKGNYTGTANKTYTITKATPVIAWSSTSQELTYTGHEAAITDPTVTLVNNEPFSGTITYSDVESGADYTVLPTEVGTYKIKARIAASENYIAAETADTLTLTIKYYDGEIPVKFTANGNELTETTWVSPATKITISASGFTVAAVATGGMRPTADEIKESSVTMSAKDVSDTTFYFRQNDTGHMTDGIQYTLNIDDNPPGGSIKLEYKFWDSFLSVISFGHYQATDKTVTITAKDDESGIQTIEYVIVTGGTSYATKEALEAANLSWQTYNSGNKPAVSVNTQSVIYARIKDKVGIVTYISSEGILLDTKAPGISGFNIAADSVTDVQARVSITVDETAAIYLVAVPTAEAGKITVAARDVIATCDANAIGAVGGSPIADAIVAWKGTLAADSGNLTGTKDITRLAPNTAYTVYAVAVDKVIDMDNSTDSKIVYTGNVSPLSSTTLTTKKAQPVIAKKPILSGTYGQTIGTMLTDGTAKDKNGAVLAGTWTVSTADQNKTPSVGTTEKITVTFTPDDAAYDTISVKITPGVSPRSLSAEGVVISQVAGIYTYDNGTEIKPPVALGTGTPTEGIYISDSGAVLAASDFTISYSDNKNAGTATVTITGKSNYTGSVTREFTIKKAAGRVIPGLTGTQTQEKDTYTYTITPIEGAVYRMGDGAWTKVGQENANIFTGITPGTSVKFSAKIPGDTNHEDGPEKDIIVNFEKLTPAAPALSYTRSTDEGTGKVTITITPVKGAQYSFDGGTTWEDANVKEYPDGSGQVALAIRLKETDTHKESPVQTVTVDLSKEDRGAPEPFTLQYAPNGETDYTVTIPPTEGCEYSFDGVAWSDENVKTGAAAGETVTGYKRYKETNEYNASGAVSDTETMPKFTVKTPVISPAGGAYTGSVGVTITCGTSGAQIYYTTDGSTPTRSSIRYTGAFTVTPTITVKAIAIKEGLEASAVVTASYTKPGGGSSGGGDSGNDDNDSDGGSGNSSGQESGSNGGSAGNKASAAPTDSPSADTKPGSDTPQKDKEPFIKGKNGKIGWDVIRAEEEKTKDGNTINVDMNGSAVVPGDIFDRLRGRDIIITFDMGNDILWSVDGKSITRDASQGRIGDIDFSVKTGANTIPVDVINNVTGESYSIQLSLAHEGEFGFTAVLSIGLGRENAGYTASLYYYNESTEKLEFICKDKIAEDGTASLAFTHASDYVIMIGEEEESCAAMKPAQQENTGGNAGNDNAAAGGNAADTEGAPAEESLKDGQENKTVWLIAAGIIALAAAALAGMLAWRKKKEDK